MKKFFVTKPTQPISEVSTLFKLHSEPSPGSLIGGLYNCAGGLDIE